MHPSPLQNPVTWHHFTSKCTSFKVVLKSQRLVGIKRLCIINQVYIQKAQPGQKINGNISPRNKT